MPVDTVSTAYAAMADRWRTARDCVIGGNAVKAGGTRYLPPLAGHNPNSPTDDYRAYLQRALFFNACARTIEALAGMIFRAEPVIECPEVAAPLIDDVDLPATRCKSSRKRSCARFSPSAGSASWSITPPRPPNCARSCRCTPPRRFSMWSKSRSVVRRRSSRSGCARTIWHQIPTMSSLRSTSTRSACWTFPTGITGSGSCAGRRQQREVVEEVVPTIDGAPLDRIPFWIITAEQTADACDIEPPLLMDLIDTNSCIQKDETT